MTEPTIAARLQHKMLCMTGNHELQATVRAALPPDWEMQVMLDLDELGSFDQLLLYRFIFLDLDWLDNGFDPQDAIRKVRMEWMLNVPIFCFGGSADERDAARLNRADRFFEHAEAAERLGQFCRQFGW